MSKDEEKKLLGYKNVHNESRSTSTALKKPGVSRNFEVTAGWSRVTECLKQSFFNYFNFGEKVADFSKQSRAK